MTINNFTDIEAWQGARKFVSEIYALTNAGTVNRDFGFTDQLRRASVSIMSNIAEGFDSGSTKSFIVFLNYSYRSASEVESLLYVAYDAGYIDECKQQELMQQIETIKNLIGGFIQYLRKHLTN